MPSNTHKICVVTGSRADYGLLYWLLRALNDDAAFELQLAVTGMHLSAEFGLTRSLIEADGFNIAATIDSLMPGDNAAAITHAMARGLAGFADAYERLRPDLVVVLGDRYEIMAAATAAYLARIPLAHIGGGDITEGAFDEALRHGITKMAHLHFVSHDEARLRVLQLGEDPVTVHVVGHPGIEQIKRLPLLPREQVEARLQFRLRPRNLLITYHPETLSARSSKSQFADVLSALEQLTPDYGLIFTRPNADTEGRALIDMLDAFVLDRENAVAFPSLGQHLYLSIAALADAVVGNSSSGIFEVPALRRPTVNIGARQKGRPLAASVISAEADATSIQSAIERALGTDCSTVHSPFGDGTTSSRIMAVLRTMPLSHGLPPKRFIDRALP